MQVLASKTKIYMVLEYVNGGELFDIIVRINYFFFFSDFYDFSLISMHY